MTPAELCAHFIRFNTSNYGDGESLGETPLADEISRILRDSGYEPESYARAPHRASVVVRVQGSDSSLPGVLVHGHIDVVPAEAKQWNVPPFEGRIEDGYVFGRGAADMKHTVASMVTILLDWAHRSVTPQRDVLFLFVADEEDTGAWGAGFLVDQHPELFTGIGAAIGESGGTATLLTAADRSPVTLYPIAVAERGTLHMRLRAEGLSGHGSRPTQDSAVTKLIGAAYRINSHIWPLQLSDTVREYITTTNEALGYELDLSTESGIEEAIVRMGEAGDVARVTIRSSATVTVLQAGYKVNVIPGIAEAKMDARCVPGAYDSTLQTLSELIGPDVAYWQIDPGPPTNFSASSPWYIAMRNTVLRHDPDAIVAPYCMGGGTDAKHFMRLGMECFGFSPLTLDPEGRRVHGVHGIDERVAVASVNGGQEMLNDFLRNV